MPSLRTRVQLPGTHMVERTDSSYLSSLLQSEKAFAYEEIMHTVPLPQVLHIWDTAQASTMDG